ncbi:hypothetical protein [uncultured Tenacibaculum sp.]|uniref:hypothetical protein n=1 Tax=uncultured Tenacibaculum sp. TaxID=174713 RepID=UPI0026323F40|nr:hypothetical protein [uncultured Tenacibaculum sp.]
MIRLVNSIKVTVVLSTILLFISCNDNNICKDTVCTLEFRTILVSVKNQDQNPIALDSFKVINIQNNSDMTVSLSNSEFEAAQQSGKYPLVNDSSLNTNEERQVQFKGYIDNKEVINSTYKVSTDCCHIGLISGVLNLTLN